MNYTCTCIYQVTWREREEEQDSQGEECKGSKVVVKPFCNDDGDRDGKACDGETCWPGRLQRILLHSGM